MQKIQWGDWTQVRIKRKFLGGGKGLGNQKKTQREPVEDAGGGKRGLGRLWKCTQKNKKVVGSVNLTS